ncbi:MAG: hypothetical protein ACO3GT_07485, partial [Candidatus Nanopelagicales bacterium]
MEPLPLRVVLNLTDPNFQSQAQILRNQVETAGGTFIEHKDLSPTQFLSQVAGYLTDGPVAVVDQGFVTGQAMMDALVKGHWSVSASVVKPSS